MDEREEREERKEMEELIRCVKEGRPLSPGTAESLLSKYPYLTLAASQALRGRELAEEQRARFRAAVALNAPDAKTLMRLIDPESAKFANFYPEEGSVQTPTTENAIDTFLDTYGHGVDPKEEALLERLIFNPVPADYSELLKAEGNDPAEAAQPEEYSEQDAMLDAFLDSQSAGREEAEANEPEPEVKPRQEYHTKPDPEAPLGESLAKIFIKRGRYDKAYEIISQLSLNFPEKSVYFADQLRFLRKLIINQRYDK